MSDDVAEATRSLVERTTNDHVSERQLYQSTTEMEVGEINHENVTENEALREKDVNQKETV